MNEDRGGLVRGNFFFSWLGFGFFCFFVLIFLFLCCFGSFFPVVFYFPSNAVLSEALAMGLVCAGGTVRAGQGPGAGERTPEAREQSLSSPLLPQ